MLDHSDYREPRHGICDAEVYDQVTLPDGEVVKVRYRIHTDGNYAHQSDGRAHVWNPRQMEWNEVASFRPQPVNYADARQATLDTHLTLECLVRAILD